MSGNSTHAREKDRVALLEAELTAAQRSIDMTLESERHLRLQLDDLQKQLEEADHRGVKQADRIARAELVMVRTQADNERLTEQLQDERQRSRTLEQERDELGAEVARLRLTLERLASFPPQQIDGVTCIGPVVD